MFSYLMLTHEWTRKMPEAGRLVNRVTPLRRYGPPVVPFTDAREATKMCPRQTYPNAE